MAVQARHFSHDFPASVGASLFLDDYYACCAPAAPAWPRDTTVLGEFPHSDLAAGCNYAFVPRKRPRLTAAECFVDGQRSGMAPSGVGGLVEVPCGVDVPITSRAAGSGAASTSGRVANGSSAASRSLVSWMHRQGVEIDAVVRLEVRAA
nr:unnamed protein product [Digitaria exilis]